MSLQDEWKDLEKQLNPRIINALLESFGFKTMMPVQKICIPLFLKNYDVAVQAATGSGKTLAYILPTLDHVIKKVSNMDNFTKETILAMIIVPTRELARQIFDIFTKILEHISDLSVALFIGGLQIQKHGSNFIVGTPGKIRELVESGIYLKDLEVLVLDEADRLLEQEFYEDLTFIIQRLPKQRRTALFSATLNSTKIKDFIKLGLRNPVSINLKVENDEKKENPNVKGNNDISVPESLRNFYTVCSKRIQKFFNLINFLISIKNLKIMIFFNTCNSVEYYYKVLSNLPQLKDMNILHMHGKMKQKKRDKICKTFGKAQQGMLISTDVTARGLDFPDVNWIIQFDPPQDPNFYIHRIGRTARTGREGNALIMLLDHETTFLNYLQVKNITISELKDFFSQTMSEDEIRNEIMKLMLSDRDYIEKGKKAFVSFIRSYKEHDLNYIFQFKNLKIGDTANSFFLPKLPRIKEILGKKIEDFTQLNINMENIPFQNQNQETQFKQKQEKNLLKKRKKEEHQELHKKQIDMKEKQKRTKSQQRQTRREALEKDIDDLNYEERLVKKLKKKQITIEEFNRRIKEIDSDDPFDTEYIDKVVISKGANSKKHK